MDKKGTRRTARGAGGPVVKAILVHAFGERVAHRYISVLLFLRRRLVPFCSLIRARNIPRKVLFTRATYTRKHFVTVPSTRPSTLRHAVRPARIVYCAPVSRARATRSARDKFRRECHSDRAGLGDRVEEPEILDLRAGITVGATGFQVSFGKILRVGLRRVIVFGVRRIFIGCGIHRDDTFRRVFRKIIV